MGSSLSCTWLTILMISPATNFARSLWKPAVTSPSHTTLGWENSSLHIGPENIREAITSNTLHQAPNREASKFLGGGVNALESSPFFSLTSWCSCVRGEREKSICPLASNRLGKTSYFSNSHLWPHFLPILLTLRVVHTTLSDKFLLCHYSCPSEKIPGTQLQYHSTSTQQPISIFYFFVEKPCEHHGLTKT